MKRITRILSFVFALAVLFGTVPTAVFASERPNITDDDADAAMLLSLDYDDVLYSHGTEAVLDPGASVKMMTALLSYTLLQARLDEYITVSRAMVTLAGNNISLMEGESIRIRDLFFAMLLHGANDAAIALAITAAGSTGEFVTQMNDMAASLGMTNTAYANCTGFHANNARTTLADTTILARAFFTKTFLMSAASVETYAIPATNKVSARPINNRNYMLSRAQTSKYYRSDARGILYGGTTDAGYCLITTVVSGGLTYMTIVMGASSYSEKNNSYDITASLLRYADEGFGLVSLLSASRPLASLPVKLSKQSDSVTVIPAHDVTAFMPVDYDASLIRYEVSLTADELSAPIDAGVSVGKVAVFYGGEKVAESELVTANSLTRSVLLEFSDAIATFLGSPLFICTLVFVIGGAVAYVILRAKAIAREKQNEQE